MGGVRRGGAYVSAIAVFPGSAIDCPLTIACVEGNIQNPCVLSMAVYAMLST